MNEKLRQPSVAKLLKPEAGGTAKYIVYFLYFPGS
jgi:hypothetical protein